MKESDWTPPSVFWALNNDVRQPPLFSPTPLGEVPVEIVQRLSEEVDELKELLAFGGPGSGPSSSNYSGGAASVDAAAKKAAKKAANREGMEEAIEAKQFQVCSTVCPQMFALNSNEAVPA